MNRRPELTQMSFTRLLLLTLASVILLTGSAAFLRSSGWTAYALQGHSMEPTIAPGSLVIARMVPAERLTVGDVAVFPVSWVGPETKIAAAHRIERIVQDGSGIRIFTKGDGNVVSDPAATVLGTTAVRASFSIPHGATMLKHAQVLGLIAAAVLLYTTMVRRMAAGLGSDTAVARQRIS